MPKRPSFQFYPADWLNNIKLQSCSLAAQGLLIDIMCLMHQSEKYGFLLINGSIPLDKSVARLLRVHHKTYHTRLIELIESGVLRRSENGSIFCKRMVDDEHIRVVRSAAGSQGGSPLLKQKVKQKDKQKQTPSSSPSSSTPKIKESATPALPQENPLSNHWHNTVGPHFQSIKADRDIIAAHSMDRKVKIDQLIGWAMNKWGPMQSPPVQARPGAVAKLILSVRKRVEADLPITNLYGYAGKVMITESQNESEREAIAFHEEMKNWDPKEFVEITKGLFKHIK